MMRLQHCWINITIRSLKDWSKSRTQLFEENDKPYLQTLPSNRFIYKEFKVATVNIDYHIELHKCFYSVPFKYLKEKVEIRYSTSHVEVYHKSSLIATHPRLYKPNATSTLKEHMPLNHQYQHEKMNPQRLKNWAASIGSNAGLFVQQRLRRQSTRPMPIEVLLPSCHWKKYMESLI